MARIRDIKPEYFLDEDVAYLPVITRYFFIGLWTLADREGRLEDRPARIRAQVFPYDSEIDVSELLDQLEESGFLSRYEVEGRKYIQIRSFARHQKPHPKEAPSRFPAPPEQAVKRNGKPGNAGSSPLGSGDLGSGDLGVGGNGKPGNPPPPEPSEPKPAELTASGLLHALRVEAESKRPELGFWNPGRFAERDAREFLERIPHERHVAFLAEVPGKIRAYFELTDDWLRKNGWPLKGFLDRYSGLATSATKSKARRTFEEIEAEERAERERKKREAAEMAARAAEIRAIHRGEATP